MNRESIIALRDDTFDRLVRAWKELNDEVIPLLAQQQALDTYANVHKAACRQLKEVPAFVDNTDLSRRVQTARQFLENAFTHDGLQVAWIENALCILGGEVPANVLRQAARPGGKEGGK